MTNAPSQMKRTIGLYCSRRLHAPSPSGSPIETKQMRFQSPSMPASVIGVLLHAIGALLRMQHRDLLAVA